MDGKVKYVQLEMNTGDQHPKLIFFVFDENGNCSMPEMVLDTPELSQMFEQAVSGSAVDIMMSEHRVSVQYNLEYTVYTQWMGK